MDEFAADLLPMHREDPGARPAGVPTSGSPLSEVKVETTKA